MSNSNTRFCCILTLYLKKQRTNMRTYAPSKSAFERLDGGMQRDNITDNSHHGRGGGGVTQYWCTSIGAIHPIVRAFDKGGGQQSIHSRRNYVSPS